MSVTLLNKDKKQRSKKFNYFIGIDVSKNKLDYAVIKNKEFLFHCERKNDEADIISFVKELKSDPQFKVTKAVFCFERTGFYCNHLLSGLSKLKTNIVVEHPLTIKNSSGLLRNKNDKVDAIRIAKYAQNFHENLKFWEPKRQVILQLMNAIAIRNRLLGTATRLKVPLKEQRSFIPKKLVTSSKVSCERTLAAIDQDLLAINQNIQALIDSDSHIKNLIKIITSVPAVGLQTAIQILICTNEFRDFINPKKFAAYSGVAPFKKESGVYKSKAKVSHIANKKMKSLLHICAVGSLRCDYEMKTYYLRKTTVEGKPPMAVLNAIRYKILLRIFVCLKQGRCYTKDYKRPENITAGEPDKNLRFET